MIIFDMTKVMFEQKKRKTKQKKNEQTNGAWKKKKKTVRQTFTFEELITLQLLRVLLTLFVAQPLVPSNSIV